MEETKNREVPNFRLLGAEKSAEMLKIFKGERTGWVQVGEKNYFFPHRYVEQGKGFFNFEIRCDDTWVMSYPRSGTTWAQELVWLVCNNLDFGTAKTMPLAQRFPFLEFSMFNHPEITKELVELNEGDTEKQWFCQEIAKPGYEVLSTMPGPRYIKTHFPLSLLPTILDSGCRIIYIARNPKDVAVSWYYQNLMFKTQGYIGDFPTFWKYYKNDLVPWSPYWEHLKEAWAQRNHPNMLFLFYEEMNQDLPKTIKKVAKFFEKSYNDSEIAQLVDYLDFKNFKINPMVNSEDLVDCGVMLKKGHFVRRGACGGWNETFTEELEKEADEWTEENLKNTDLRFPSLNNNSEKYINRN